MDVKPESLKELRNKILRIFGESLDDYTREKDELGKSIGYLAENKAKLVEEISLLANKKAKLSGEYRQVEDLKVSTEKEITQKKSDAQRIIEESYLKTNTEFISRENAVRIKEKKQSENDLSNKAWEERLAGDELDLKKQLALLKGEELEIEKAKEKNTKWTNQLSDKERELKILEEDLDKKLEKADEIESRLQKITAMEAELERSELLIREKIKEISGKTEKLSILEKELEIKKIGLEDKAILLNNKEIWLDDRARTAKSQSV